MYSFTFFHFFCFCLLESFHEMFLLIRSVSPTVSGPWGAADAEASCLHTWQYCFVFLVHWLLKTVGLSQRMNQSAITLRSTAELHLTWLLYSASLLNAETHPAYITATAKQIYHFGYTNLQPSYSGILLLDALICPIATICYVRPSRLL